MRSYLCIAPSGEPARTRRVDFDRMAELFAAGEERAPAEVAPACAWAGLRAAWRDGTTAARETLALLRAAAGHRGRPARRAFSA